MKPINKVRLREKYFNGYLDLQYKHKDKKENIAVLVLLSIFFMEYLSNGVSPKIITSCLFITKIQNIDNAKVVLNSVDKALTGEGKLSKYLDDFKEINKDTLSYLTHIIPQKGPNIKVSSKYQKQEDMKERTDLTESNNKASLYINKVELGKKTKQWNTQRDRKVRKTTFHNNVDRQVVSIQDYFKVGTHKAICPADSNLPSYDRFNCRCYLTYY